MKVLLWLIVSLVGLSACDHGGATGNPIQISGKNKITITDNFSSSKSQWRSFAGEWIFNGEVLKQTSSSNDFPLILRMDQSFTDLDVSVGFKPVSGHIDASGGIVIRAVDKDNYYIVRANALENNFRLYTFKDGYRRQLASATVSPPALGEFHSMRVVAKGDHLQAYLNGALLLDLHDQSFTGGYVGLWTKADSVTEFDDLLVVGVE
jgi:hypothetical protein